MPVGVRARVVRPKVNPVVVLIGAFGTGSRPGPLLLEARKESQLVAEGLAKELRDAIYKNRFKMKPLTAAYLAYKREHGLDPRVLISQKKYVRAIKAMPTPFGSRVGIARGVRTDGGKRIRYDALQKWLEYGTRHRLPNGRVVVVPARPHWRPMMKVWRENRARYGLRIKSRVGAKMAELLRAHGATIGRR